MAEPLLACRGLSKSFGPVKANRRIDLDLHPGEVHALLGENGAGKSTLMSMLAGRYRPDEGAILLRGEETRFTSPAKAWEAGIGMVYQRFMLVDSFTAAENVRLAVPGVGRRELRALGERYGLAVNPDARVADLSMGERQRVEILKLLARGARVLIFDEPTSSLSPPEVDSLFEIMERLKAEGHALVFITHKLDEVMRTADVISILRRGRIVAGGLRPSDISNRRELARLMVGREVVLSVDKEPVEKGGVVLEARNLRGAGPSPAFTDVNLDVRKGEVVALAGVAGNGQSRLAKALAGVEPAGAGTLSCLGDEVQAAKFRGHPSLAYVPEDRDGEGSVAGMDLTENFLLTRSTGWLLDLDEAECDVYEAMANFDIAAPGPWAMAGTLSGGNLQKLILARELSSQPEVLIAEQPTQGLDVRATEEVWKALLSMRQRAGVLLVTGDLKEAFSLADRIAVIFRGRIMDVLETSDPETMSRVGLLMAGVEEGETA